MLIVGPSHPDAHDECMNESAVLEAVAMVSTTDLATADEATCRAVLEHSRRGRGFFDAAEAMAT